MRVDKQTGALAAAALILLAVLISYNLFRDSVRSPIEINTKAVAAIASESTDTTDGTSKAASVTASSSISKAAPVSDTQTEAATTEATAPESELININTAEKDELIRLNGIGEIKAQAIIDYRKENGRFGSVDELINVYGIGEKTLEKLRPYITV